jgi:hypothetical protein
VISFFDERFATFDKHGIKPVFRESLNNVSQSATPQRFNPVGRSVRRAARWRSGAEPRRISLNIDYALAPGGIRLSMSSPEGKT